MKSEILKEIEKNCVEIMNLINAQKFTIEDAKKYLERYGNFYLKMESLEDSRDNWKKKYKKLKKKMEKRK